MQAFEFPEKHHDHKYQPELSKGDNSTHKSKLKQNFAIDIGDQAREGGVTLTMITEKKREMMSPLELLSR